MTAIENKVVSIFYELKDANGNLLDSNMSSAPLSFIMGKNQIIPGLEREIANLKQGDSSDITVIAADAYGEYSDKAIQTLPAEQFAGIQLSNGMTLYGQGEDGNTVQAIVKEFNEQEVTIDFNHPLAGQDLYFKIEVAEVRDASKDELKSGYVSGSHQCSCGFDDDCCGGEHHHDDGDCCGKH
ncbi:MAG: peptidylprolyl isomerase [Campylobacteraceae bacterium]|jgi:FKBP-type peptidyl-prolyl cis-trans isomerase SlyD|nr:peptidylprolyl isomerase [Campylobacteraceae bacterium]